MLLKEHRLLLPLSLFLSSNACNSNLRPGFTGQTAKTVRIFLCNAFCRAKVFGKSLSPPGIELPNVRGANSKPIIILVVVLAGVSMFLYEVSPFSKHQNAYSGYTAVKILAGSGATKTFDGTTYQFTYQTGNYGNYLWIFTNSNNEWSSPTWEKYDPTQGKDYNALSLDIIVSSVQQNGIVLQIKSQ